jgi:ubiquitin-like-conjugating enzyme ATG10
MITQEDFHQQCKEFVNRPSAVKQGWTWNEKGYCSLEQVHCLAREFIFSNNNSEQCDIDDDETLEDIDEEDVSVIPSCTVSTTSSNDTIPICFKYHILFSESFQVPVLYFNAYNAQDSSLLSREQVLNFVTNENQKKSGLIPSEDLNPYTMITQGEHLILGTIFYYIHPCETANLMDMVLSTSTTGTLNYIVSWLSFFGRLVSLNVPLELVNECN